MYVCKREYVCSYFFIYDLDVCLSACMCQIERESVCVLGVGGGVARQNCKDY